MAPSLFELKLRITSAKDLKNVNWRHGSLKPSVSTWVEPTAKSSTKVDHDGDTSPSWNETLHILIPSSIDDSALYLEIVHDESTGEDGTESIVGSACLSLRDVVDDVGFGVEAFLTLDLQPQGKVDVGISVKDLQDSLFRTSDQYDAALAYSASRFSRFQYRSSQKCPYDHIVAVAEAEAEAEEEEEEKVLDPLEDNFAKKLDLTRSSDRYDATPYSMINSPVDNELRHVRYCAYPHAPSVYMPIGAKADEECGIEETETLSNVRVFAFGASDGRALPDGSDLSKENIVTNWAKGV